MPNMIKLHFMLCILLYAQFDITASQMSFVSTTLQTVKTHHFLVNSSELLRPFPFTIYSHCLLTCTQQLGYPSCLAMNFVESSRLCNCGIVDYTNRAFNSTSEIALYINDECKVTEGNNIIFVGALTFLKWQVFLPPDTFAVRHFCHPTLLPPDTFAVRHCCHQKLCRGLFAIKHFCCIIRHFCVWKLCSYIGTFGVWLLRS